MHVRAPLWSPGGIRHFFSPSDPHVWCRYTQTDCWGAYITLKNISEFSTKMWSKGYTFMCVCWHCSVLCWNHYHNSVTIPPLPLAPPIPMLLLHQTNSFVKQWEAIVSVDSSSHWRWSRVTDRWPDSAARPRDRRTQCPARSCGLYRDTDTGPLGRLWLWWRLRYQDQWQQRWLWPEQLAAARYTRVRGSWDR